MFTFFGVTQIYGTAFNHNVAGEDAVAVQVQVQVQVQVKYSDGTGGCSQMGGIRRGIRLQG